MTKRRGQAAPPDWIETHRAEAVPVDLDDVVGLAAAKRELVALAARLTRPHDQLAIPRGVLLWGPPGCGKTLLARAFTDLLAGADEAVSLYEFRATEFLEQDAFGRIADAFADRAGRAVIFVDEIDLFGRRRDDHRHTPDTRQALYTALALLDGLRRRDELTWLFATSSTPLTLDPALLRPGRVDVHIEVGFADQAERETLLARLTAQLPVSGPLDLPRASAMLGHHTSPAAVRALCQDAFGLALSDGLDGIDWPHLVEAIRREGHVTNDEQSDAVRWRTAVHEAGHAIAARLLDLPVANVTILTRHGGRMDLDEHKPRLQTRTDDWLRRAVTVKLAGLVAERVVFGEAALGCESDIDGATAAALARLDAGLEPAFGPLNRFRFDGSDQAADAAFALSQRYLRDRLADAERLVTPAESAVCRFAAILLTERQLSGQRLEDALEDALPRPGTPIVHDVETTAIASAYTQASPTIGAPVGEGR